MRGQVEVAERRADAADTDRRIAQTRLEHAEAGREGDRARADVLHDRLTTMQEQLADAHAALQAAESADARAVRAEQDKERAEASSDAERARADPARPDRRRCRRQLTARQEVIDAAEAIRKADDARLARGRLGRASGGWRGR